MWRKILTATILTMLPHGILLAEEQQSNGIKHALGASVGWIVGSGLSYRHYFDNYYTQTSFVASAKELSDDTSTNDDIY